MANEPRKPFQSPAPLPLPTPASSTKDKDKGGAALPLWNTGGTGDKLAGMPLFRGANQKSGGIVGRLKSLKTKDVAFIGAGLAVLVMAPLAEYLISEGEDKAGQLQGGFASNSSPFNEGRDPSEIGIMGLARGGVPGDGSDVITPLNARDPSSLIMGGNGEQKEAPATAAVEPKRDAPKDSVWDKVVSSAKSGASAATRKVSLPKPGGKLAGAINGLRSLSGGSTGASLKLAAPDSKGLFSAPKSESHLAATQGIPGMRGVGPRSPAGGNGGNSSGRFGGGLSGGGGSAGDVMNGAGGISGGGRGSGFSGGDGEPTKNPGGNSTKDAKTLGESLAFLRQKMEMEKAIDLKWAKKRYDELERKKMIEQTLVQTAQQAFMKVLDKLLEGKKDGGGGGSGGGGSPPGGGGAPTGGTGPKDPTADLPNAGAGRLGLSSVGTVGQAAKKDKATEAAGESARVSKETGEKVETLGKNSTELDALAKKLVLNDDSQKRIHAALTTASKSVKGAADEHKAALEKVTEPQKQIEAGNKEFQAAKSPLDKSVQAQQTQLAAADAVLGVMKDPQNTEGEKYDNLKSGSADAIKAEEIKTAVAALTDPKEKQVTVSAPELKTQDAIKAIDGQAAAVAAEYDKMIAADPKNTALAGLKADMQAAFDQVKGNIQASGRNVNQAFKALEAAKEAHTNMAKAYTEARKEVVDKHTKSFEAANEAKKAFGDYTGDTKNNTGPKDKRDAAKIKVGAANGTVSEQQQKSQAFGQKL